MFRKICYILLCLGLVGQNIAFAATPTVIQSRSARETIEYFSKTGDVKALERMQKEGYSLDAQDKDGNTALCSAVLNTNPKAFVTLQKLGASTSHECMGRVPAEQREQFLKAYSHKDRLTHTKLKTIQHARYTLGLIADLN